MIEVPSGNTEANKLCIQILLLFPNNHQIIHNHLSPILKVLLGFIVTNTQNVGFILKRLSSNIISGIPAALAQKSCKSY
jgi:hypothetical protein